MSTPTYSLCTNNNNNTRGGGGVHEELHHQPTEEGAWNRKRLEKRSEHKRVQSPESRVQTSVFFFLRDFFL
jgi:hypothetical protein